MDTSTRRHELVDWSVWREIAIRIHEVSEQLPRYVVESSFFETAWNNKCETIRL